MKTICLLMTGLLLSAACSHSQNPVRKKVGGPCEGCEAIYEYGQKKLSPADTLPDYTEKGIRLKITGKVFLKDGKTPARDVILYIYHTDQTGLYTARNQEKGWGKRHGSLRGWIRTDASGQYTFYTLRPVAYPDRSEPEHIHLTVKEPGKNEYYLDDFLFENDPLLTAAKKAKLQNRGGSGIMIPEKMNDYFLIKRNIILGLNIPDYE